jgi:hypothetical protein
MAWRVEWESHEVHVWGANSICIGANKRHRKGLTTHQEYAVAALVEQISEPQ